MRPIRLAALVALATTASAVADVVHLKGGGRLVGRVEEHGDRIRVFVAGGATTVPTSCVESIEREESPEAAVTRRRCELKDGDAAGAAALAEFAGDAGLVAQRGDLLDLAARWAPTDDKIRAALDRWRIFDRPLRDNPSAESALAASVGKDAKIHRTAHWRIAYDAEFALVRRRGELLEAAWRKFERLVEKSGLAVRPIDDRLECVVFRERDAWFKAVAQPEDRLAGAVGIYAWTSRRILLYDTRTSPDAKSAESAVLKAAGELIDARALLDKEHAEIAKVEQAVVDATSAPVRDDAVLAQLRAWLADAHKAYDAHLDAIVAREADVKRYRGDVAHHYADENVSSTTHEACHQIAFAFGVSRPGQPTWLVEGLATLFEAQSRSSFVLEAPNVPRLNDARIAWSHGDGGKLRRVVSDAVFGDKGREPLAYAESWSLAYFLANRRPEAFARFLAEGALFSSGPDSGAKRVAEFQRVFGDDLDALEYEWRGYVERL